MLELIVERTLPLSTEVTPESIAAAKASADLERARVDHQQELERAQLTDEVILLCERFGYARIARIVRNAAHLAGQEV